MLRIKKISEVLGKQVYTADGDYFGQVEEVSLVDNKIEGWRIRVGPGLAGVLGGARGVIIPHGFVKAIGDVFIITKGNLPGRDAVAPAAGDELGVAMNSASEELL
jgi:sporulation protein YlmC with PRC-barrel domain